jgi:glycosyltransferase involved in cell wall biosynthesis
MRVCHLSSAHGQEDTRIFHKECVSLVNAGYEVYEVTKGESYEKAGVHIVGAQTQGKGRIARMLGTTKAVYKKALELDADLYHGHDPELLPVLMKLKRKGKKVIFDSHEHTANAITEKTYIPGFLRKLVKAMYESYQTRVCRKLDAIVTATPNVTDYFKSVGCRRVVDLCNFPILNSDFHEPDYCSRILSFAGGISSQWNHDHIIRALEKVENVQYVLCGTAGESYLEKLKTIRSWNKVKFLGKLPFEQVSSVLNGSAAGLSLLTPGANTDWENGNMANTKIFEEMMAGLPVICTNFVRWKQFVEEYDCGICIDPHDESQIVDAIRALIDHPESAREKGLNGRRAVEERFNWGVEEKKLIALYQEIEGEK